MIMGKRTCAILVTAFVGMLALTGCVKVVKTGEEAALTGAVSFNAGDDVANFWETTAVPEMKGKAAELAEVLNSAGGDLSTLAAEDYAKYSMGDKGELTYTVKGTASITEVVTDKKAGYIVVKPEGYDGDDVIKLQIGTVYKGTSVRDSLNFIDFNDYTNQIEWAEVSQSINELIQQKVIDPIGYDAFEVGKTVEFLGAFTVSSSNEILITPTELTIQ